MESILISSSLRTVSLPFTSLPIEIRLFQTEIMLGFLGVIFFLVYFGYQFIRNNETNEKIQGIDNGNIKNIPKDVLFEEIISLISKEDWLDIKNTKVWYEKLLRILESELQVTLDRSQIIHEQKEISREWKTLLYMIEEIRYSQDISHEITEKTRENLIHELINLQNRIGNSSIQ